MQSAVYATETSTAEYLTYTTEESEKLEVERMAAKTGSMEPVSYTHLTLPTIRLV